MFLAGRRENNFGRCPGNCRKASPTLKTFEVNNGLSCVSAKVSQTISIRFAFFDNIWEAVAIPLVFMEDELGGVAFPLDFSEDILEDVVFRVFGLEDVLEDVVFPVFGLEDVGPNIKLSFRIYIL